MFRNSLLLGLLLCMVATTNVQAADYVVTFATSNVAEAGTDSRIYITLIGADGKKTQPVYANRLVSGDAFEKDTKNVIEFTDQEFVDPTQVLIKMENYGVGPEWHLDYINVEVKTLVVIAGTPYPQTVSKQFGVGDWVKEGEQTFGGQPKYNITIKTGSKSGGLGEETAGTDSNIDLKILGSNGDTNYFRLNKLINGNAFEANQTDRVTITTTDIGEIKGIDLVSKGDYSGPGWWPESVTVSKDGQPPVTFTIREWIEDGNLHVRKRK